MKYNSIVSSEIVTFLAQRKMTCSKETYAHDIQQIHLFDEYLIAMGCKDKNISEELVYGWINSLPVKRSTVQKYVTCLRAFLTHLSGYGFHPFIPDPIHVSDDFVPYIYSDEELKRIFQIADSLVIPVSQLYPYRHIEMPVVLRILYGCGMRLGEVLKLKMKNLDFEKGVFLLEKTKSREQRFVPFTSSLKEILVKYCIKMDLIGRPERFLFPGKDYETPLTGETIKTPFRAIILRRAEIAFPERKEHERGPCLHSFRHVFAHKAFENGITNGWIEEDMVPWLSVYLGHYDMIETEKYLKDGGNEAVKYTDIFDAYIKDLLPEVTFNE